MKCRKDEINRILLKGGMQVLIQLKKDHVWVGVPKGFGYALARGPRDFGLRGRATAHNCYRGIKRWIHFQSLRISI
jgi:hypothetical protein